MLLETGEIVITPGATEALYKTKTPPSSLLQRHAACDWGNLEKEDKKLNDEAVKNGGRILSAYLLKDKTKLWIITEADRSSTTILLPEEY